MTTHVKHYNDPRLHTGLMRYFAENHPLWQTDYNRGHRPYRWTTLKLARVPGRSRWKPWIRTWPEFAGWFRAGCKPARYWSPELLRVFEAHAMGAPIPTPRQFTYDFFKPRARFNYKGPRNHAPTLQPWQVDDFVAKHATKYWEISAGVSELCAFAAGLPISDEQHAAAIQGLQWLYGFLAFTVWVRNPLPVGLVPKEHSATSKKLPMVTYPARVNKMLRCLENPLSYTEAHLERWLPIDPATHAACATWTSRSKWRAGGLDIG